VPQVHGFLDRWDKDDHFQRHGGDFGAATADEYESLAIAFLGGDMSATMVECVRRGGDRLRFDKVSYAFGVCARDGYIRTFYKCNKLIHRQKSHFQYFKGECAK
jgi:pyocin large subunit-like protein